jgi:hypothetical protein
MAVKPDLKPSGAVGIRAKSEVFRIFSLKFEQLISSLQVRF